MYSNFRAEWTGSYPCLCSGEWILTAETRDEIKNYIPGSIMGREDGSELLAQFENLDDAKKAFAEYHSSYGYVGGNLEIEEIYLEAYIADEDGDFIVDSNEVGEFAPLGKYSLEEYHYDKLCNKYGTNIWGIPERTLDVKAENGDYIIGAIFGDDECFEGNNFYQYVVTSDGIYKVYYDDDNVTDVEDIDYSKATRIELITFDDITDII